MWEPLSVKLKTIAEDIPAIITRAVESSTRRLQDDLFNLKTENSTMRVEVEKLSFSLTLAEIEHSRVEDAMNTELRLARKEATDLRHKAQQLAQEKIELESKIVPYRVKVADLEALMKADAVKVQKLEKRSADRETLLGQVEKARDDAIADLAKANEEKGKVAAELAQVQAESKKHRKQKALEKRVKELEHDNESLHSDLEAAQGSVELMRGMVEKARREYLLQVQETIKMEILMGQTVGPLDWKVAELQAENSSLLERSQMVEELEAENSSLRQ
ncbi:uncharacterized protein [Phaseolus vulgaris]|uniref:uncharacterized protein n=1 Tax=Phaseolus vulgaris TaxID=3885 RepID=UPI0035CAB9D9